MAEIRFQLLKQANGQAALPSLAGSGLAFYGATAGSSVQIGAYQSVTRVANGSGSEYADDTNNIKYVAERWPSGQCDLDGGVLPTASLGLTGIKTMQGTLGIEFGHASAINVQNVQLRIYDRENVNYPASGVNTKAAEIVNFNGSTYATQGSTGAGSTVVGSGDIWWWGEPWPAEYCSKNYYTNSSAVTFYNGLSSETATNGDARLRTAGVAGSYDTVGGTGLIMPLLDSPGSGGKQLQNSEMISNTGMLIPKWTQYLTDSMHQYSVFSSSSAYSYGDGTALKNWNYGGTGIDTHHTWSVALSASPLSTGSKEAYGLYVSLE